MNTQKSDAMAKKWKIEENPLRRVSFTEQRTFQSPPDKIFALLCPTTELDWLPEWSCELLHSQSGYAELNCIFKTMFFGLDEIFICTRYEKNLAIDYLRMSEHISGKIDIKLLDHCNGSTTGVWLITLSALDETGNEMLKDTSGIHAQFGKALDALEYYLLNGEMISLKAL
jgi:hypothetical protein